MLMALLGQLSLDVLKVIAVIVLLLLPKARGRSANNVRQVQLQRGAQSLAHLLAQIAVLPLQILQSIDDCTTKRCN